MQIYPSKHSTLNFTIYTLTIRINQINVHAIQLHYVVVRDRHTLLHMQDSLPISTFQIHLLVTPSTHAYQQ